MNLIQLRIFKHLQQNKEQLEIHRARTLDQDKLSEARLAAMSNSVQSMLQKALKLQGAN